MAVMKLCGGCGRRSGYSVYNISVGLSLVFLLFGTCSGFFIDLEALGFSTSKSDELDGARNDDDTQSTGPKLLIAAPSEHQEMVEIESKSDPTKSVKLTLAELKQLVLGTVKDLTPNPPPINIKITASKDRPAATTTTPAPKPKKKQNKYKYKQDSMLVAYAKSRDPESISDEDVWKRPQSTSFILPPYDDDDIEEHYRNSNEVMDISEGIGNTKTKGGSDERGWFDTAKAVFRAPTHVVSSYSKSFSRWRNGGKSKPNKQRHRPIADITYTPEQRRRNKRPQPSRSGRRPGSGRPRGGPNQRRRGQYQTPHNRQSSSSYYDDKYDTSEYSSYGDNGGRYSSTSSGYYGGAGDEAWDRTDHLTSQGARFDSTMPHDDMPYNMGPPLPY